MSSDKKVHIGGDYCGWDRNGVFHCLCGKCRTLREQRELTVGFSGMVWDTVLVFQTEEAFRKALSGNPNMIPIIGDTDADRNNFPNVYIAGIRAGSELTQPVGKEKL